MSRQYYWRTVGRKNKYNNRKVEIDGLKFDSMKEARRYAELKMLEDAGVITGLSTQVTFQLQPGFRDKFGKKQRPITYVADFTYYDEEDNLIIEDVKSPATRKNTVYRLKKKMMAYQGYYITEV